MTITFIGHGYVGLVTASVFADFGNCVWVVGHTPKKIERLKKGDPIIYEPGLQELLNKNLKAGRIKFTLDYKKAVPSSDIVFIAVGTPPKADGEADLSAVLKVAEEIGRHLRKGFTVVSCKSTVPVGTNKQVESIIQKVKPSFAKFAVASCPEFLREGTGIYDTLNADRVVIGSFSKEAVNLLLELHKPINGKRIITDLVTAELIKYTSNAMLATKISFANLISFYCEKTGADVETVLDAVGLDKRIGRIFMDSGVGYGGSCLPKDVKALINIGSKLSIDTALLNSVELVNAQSRMNLLSKILKNVKTKKITIWGLSFKPNTDDIREAPSLYLIRELLNNGYTLNVYDSAALENIKKVFGGKLKYFTNPYAAVKDSSALVILTEWNEFKQIDLLKVKKLMKNPMIFDGRNIYSLVFMKKTGFIYFSTGRITV
jgi:UDPglucose 6-dehydrogenase